MVRALPFAVVSALLSFAPFAVQAAPADAGPVISSSERPYTATEADAKAKLASFGLCNAPQNADDLPTSPVAVQEDTCTAYQRYESNSVNASNGSSCGGYTVAFGPMGDLKTNWKRHYLNATWGDTPLTQAQCGKARLSAVAWGARCTNADCSTTVWDKIGGPSSKKGTWSTNQNRCFLEYQFSNGTNHYKTLNIDIITSLQEGSQTVRKKAHAVIRVEKGNGKCASATDTVRPPPMQAASQAGASASYPQHTKP